MKFDMIRKRKECLVGEEVYIREYKNQKEKKWVRAVVKEKVSDQVYECEVAEPKVIQRRHVDQIIKTGRNPMRKD